MRHLLLNKPKSGLLGFLLLIGLTACNSDSAGTVSGTPGNGSRIEMTPPDKIALSKAVVQDALVLRVLVNGQSVVMQADPTTGIRSGNISLPAGSESTIAVAWSENFEGQVLGLGTASRTVNITTDQLREQEVRFFQSDFNFSIDDDNDDRSNLRERNENTDPRDAASPGEPVLQVRVVVRVQLPDDRVLNDGVLLDSITPVATFGGSALALNREGNSWVGEATAPENSSAFVTVDFFQEADQRIKLATLQRSEDVGSGAEFVFATGEYDSNSIDEDSDSLSNLEEVLQGHNPLDSNSPARNPCDVSQFESGCNTDTDGDGKPDSAETETADADQDGTPNFLESANTDDDEDGRNAEVDSNDNDACVPSVNNVACQTELVDTDGDGKSDVEEGPGDKDGDGRPDIQESSINDADDDGESDETDAENQNPCVPNSAAQACLVTLEDSDGDGKSDVNETTTADTDGDGKPDFLESSIQDSDSDNRVDELDRDDADPCVPNTTNDACADTRRDTDGDGETDESETLTADADGDGTPDFQESSVDDADSDGTVDELDANDTDPCLPTTDNTTCAAQTQDTDGDGESDVSETFTIDTDGDGIFDYQESSVDDADSDGTVDELDANDADPCLPTTDNTTCTAQTEDTDGDGKTDVSETFTADTDGDGIFDFQESSIDDADSDGTFDELDANDTDPCLPTTDNTTCTALSQDTDGDGKTDTIETFTIDTDSDGIEDYLESAILDEDNDGSFDEEDPDNLDPCIPDALATACV